jgi:hypothetical protein
LQSSGASQSRKRLRAKRLGTKKFSIQPGSTKVVRIKLSRRTLRTLRKRKRLRARATATSDSVVDSRKQVTSATVTLRAPKKRRR